MQNQGFKEFDEIWAAAWEMVGRNLTGRAILFAFDALKSNYTLDQVRQALALHSQGANGKNPPTVADIVDIITGAEGVPDADEAWAIAVRAADEDDTVVWTKEITDAWDLASELYRVDEVGARLAFRSRYEWNIGLARAAGRKPEWSVSPGYDKRLRAARVAEAVRLGRLDAATAAQFGLEEPRTSMAGLLADMGKRERDESARQALAGLKAAIEGHLVDLGGDGGMQGIAR